MKKTLWVAKNRDDGSYNPRIVGLSRTEIEDKIGEAIYWHNDRRWLPVEIEVTETIFAPEESERVPEIAKIVARMLDGHFYPLHLPQSTLNLLKEYGLVAVYGLVEYIMVFAGAVTAKVDCREAATLAVRPKTKYVRKGGLCARSANPVGRPITAHYQPTHSIVREILGIPSFSFDPKAIEELRADWMYQTDIPHCSFTVKHPTSDRDYCQGIVFSVVSLPS